MSVSVSCLDGEDIEFGEPLALFRVAPGSEYDVASDGQTFLISQSVDTDRAWPIMILTD